MKLSKKRLFEQSKYNKLYKMGGYGSQNHGRYMAYWLYEQNPQSIIDVGCGQNDFCHMCSSFCPECVGVDISCEKADFVAPAHKLPVEDGSFEWLTAFDTMEHLLPDEVDEVIEEFRRVATVGWLFSIAYEPSQRNVKGSNLHPTVRNRKWWIQKLMPHIRVQVANIEYKLKRRTDYLYGRFQK